VNYVVWKYGFMERTLSIGEGKYDTLPNEKTIIEMVLFNKAKLDADLSCKSH